MQHLVVCHSRNLALQGKPAQVDSRDLYGWPPGMVASVGRMPLSLGIHPVEEPAESAVVDSLGCHWLATLPWLRLRPGRSYLAAVGRPAWGGTVVGLVQRLVLVPAAEWVEVEMEVAFPG